jgi:hypothetical protein
VHHRQRVAAQRCAPEDIDLRETVTARVHRIAVCRREGSAQCRQTRCCAHTAKLSMNSSSASASGP